MLARLTAILCMTLSTVAFAKGSFGEAAPDFPPGQFSDGKSYALDKLRGKVVVLFFYESGCPTCAKSIPQRNAVMKKYDGKPVQFLAIAAGDSQSEVDSYVRSTGLAMPVFIDSLSLMEDRYGFKISLNNIYQTRVIDADGTIVAYDMEEASIDKALASVKAPYAEADYHEKLKPVVRQLNAGDHAQAVRKLRTLVLDRDETVMASAQKLTAAVLAEGEAWKTAADGLVASDPVRALGLYM